MHKQFKTWEEVKHYLDDVDKVIKINGVKNISITFHDYSTEDLYNWYIDITLKE